MNERQRFTFRKNERVTGVKRIEQLFAGGKSFVAYPLRVVYALRAFDEKQARVAILTSVPKKRLKKAVERNRIKRLMREAYRLNKHLLDTDFVVRDKGVDIAMVYIKDTVATYSEIEKGVKKALNEMNAQLKKEREA